jgi:hypothetical protein
VYRSSSQLEGRHRVPTLEASRDLPDSQTEEPCTRKKKYIKKRRCKERKKWAQGDEDIRKQEKESGRAGERESGRASEGEIDKRGHVEGEREGAIVCAYMRAHARLRVEERERERGGGHIFIYSDFDYLGCLVETRLMEATWRGSCRRNSVASEPSGISFDLESTETV